MSFFASNNRIWVTDASNNLMFDTDRKMPAITATLTGAVYMPGYTDAANRYYDVGAAPVGTEFVFPTYRATFTTAGETARIPNGIPFSSVGSVLINATWFYDVTPGFHLVSARIVTPVVIGGRVYLHEDVFDWDAGGPDCTLEYKIYLGRFV